MAHSVLRTLFLALMVGCLASAGCVVGDDVSFAPGDEDISGAVDGPGALDVQSAGKRPGVARVPVVNVDKGDGVGVGEWVNAGDDFRPGGSPARGDIDELDSAAANAAEPALNPLEQVPWAPDPGREYILTNLASKTPMASRRGYGRPYQGTIGDVSDNTRWVFTPVEGVPGVYFIDRASGGPNSRLQVGDFSGPRMRAGSYTGDWVRFRLVDAGNGKHYIESLAADPFKPRISFGSDGTITAVNSNSNGWLKKFIIKESEEIINDVPWETAGDQNAMHEIKAGKGGQLSRIDGTWYWVGTDPNIDLGGLDGNGGDLHLYASDTLGHETWRYLGVVVDADACQKPAGNCKLVQHPGPGERYFVIICKSNAIYKSRMVDGVHSITGPYDKQDGTNIESYRRRHTYDGEGELVEGSFRHKFGGGSLFIDDDGSAYFITSRKNTDYRLANLPGTNRNVGIYKLQDDWLDFEAGTAEVYYGPNVGREAMFLLKRRGVYFMMSSHTSGWDPSKTYYRTATNLAGPWSDERELRFVPALRERDGAWWTVKSHGVQFRYMINLGHDKWMYGGDRYPDEEAEKCLRELGESECPMNNADEPAESCDPPKWKAEYGRHMRLPVVWGDDNIPRVFWRKKWNVGTFDYTDIDASIETHCPIPGVDSFDVVCP